MGCFRADEPQSNEIEASQVRTVRRECTTASERARDVAAMDGPIVLLHWVRRMRSSMQHVCAEIIFIYGVLLMGAVKIDTSDNVRSPNCRY